MVQCSLESVLADREGQIYTKKNGLVLLEHQLRQHKFKVHISSDMNERQKRMYRFAIFIILCQMFLMMYADQKVCVRINNYFVDPIFNTQNVCLLDLYTSKYFENRTFLKICIL